MEKKNLNEWEKATRPFSVFRSVAYIGDSLSSGELVSRNADGENEYNDYFDQSWGQYMARIYQHTAYNFSRGGMTAQEYMTGYADRCRWFDPSKAAQAYIIALGVNDLFGKGQDVGSTDDIDLNDPEENADTFAGWMGRIISRYKSIQPRAKFFLVTMPRVPGEGETRAELRLQHRKLLTDMCELFPHTFLIDLYSGSPDHGEEFVSRYYMNGHLTPAGYYLTAEFVGALADDVVRSDPHEFRDVGFIGTDLKE